MEHVTLVQQVRAVLAGVIVGFSLGLIGGGGSILAVPLLFYVVGYHNPHVVIVTTALALALTAFINLIRTGARATYAGSRPSPSPSLARWELRSARRSGKSFLAKRCCSCLPC